MVPEALAGMTSTMIPALELELPKPREMLTTATALGRVGDLEGQLPNPGTLLRDREHHPRAAVEPMHFEIFQVRCFHRV